MGKSIKEFVENYKAKKFMNTRQGVDERAEWLRKELEIKSYIPFREKRQIAEMIVEQNIEVVDGVKKYDSISGYVGLVVASISAHTNLEWSSDPISDYDLLAENGFLEEILAEFEGSHSEINLLMNMTLDAELEDNEVGAIIGRLLNNILETLGGVSGALKDKFKDLNLSEFLGEDFKVENLAKLTGLLDKLK